MPLYYSQSDLFSTNGASLTVSSHYLALTGAAVFARFVGLYGGAKGSTAGGGILRIVRCGTAGTGGGAATEQKRNPNAQAPLTVLTTTPTTGGTPATQLTVGFAQTGGQGGWVALEPDHAVKLLPAGGANGNLEVHSMAIGTSIPIELSLEWNEE